VTTDWVLVELGNYLAGRPSRRLFGPFVNDLSRDSRFQIFPANAEWLDDGIKLYEQRPDKEWSLTDCLSFVVMKNEGLLDAITTDHHFEQAGFHILLKPE
jgi:predicted nucleic acid-binding protein